MARAGPEPGRPAGPARIHSGRLLTLGIAAVVYAAAARADLWAWFAVPHLVPDYLDLHAVLAAVDCHRLGYDVYAANPCDANLRPHGYSRLWLALGGLGLTREDGSWLGFLLGMLFAAAAALTLDPRRPREVGVSCLALLSPAVMLGVERANNDLVVFLLLLAAAGLMTRRGVWATATSYAVVWLAAFLKFYPVFALALFLERVRSRRQLWLLIGGSAAILAVLVWFVLPDLEGLRNAVPSPVRRWTFGARLLFLSLGLDHGLLEAAGGVVMAAAAAGLGLRFRLGLDDVPHEDRALYLASAALLLGCFFANTNYDYRCVFFLGAFPLLFRLWSSTGRTEARLAAWLLAGISVVLWFELAVDLLAIGTGVPRPDFLAADRIQVPGLKLVEQLVTWAVLTAVAWIAFCLLRERGSALRRG